MKKQICGSLLAYTLALVVTGCASSEQKASLTEKQACMLAMKEFPASKDEMYFAQFASGTWHISVLKDINSSTNPSPRIEVATVRDSDGKVEIIEKP